MTTKDKILLKLNTINEEEPVLQQILDILEAKALSKKETTLHGRMVRTREDLMKMDCCPYPKEDDL